MFTRPLRHLINVLRIILLIKRKQRVWICVDEDGNVEVL